MFLNNCNQQPLYNGSMEKVRPFFADIYNSAPYMMNAVSEEMNNDMNNDMNMADDTRNRRR
jgi:hypothetical protein